MKLVPGDLVKAQGRTYGLRYICLLKDFKDVLTWQTDIAETYDRIRKEHRFVLIGILNLSRYGGSYKIREDIAVMLRLKSLQVMCLQLNEIEEI